MSMPQPVSQQPYDVTMPQATHLPGQPMMASTTRQKEVGTAYLLWFFFGFLGVHQFYLGKNGRGVLYLLTFGGLGIGTLIDLFTLAGQVRQVNTEIATGVR